MLVYYLHRRIDSIDFLERNGCELQRYLVTVDRKLVRESTHLFVVALCTGRHSHALF